MKLGTVRKGTAYCLNGFDFGIWDGSHGFTRRGTVPNLKIDTKGGKLHYSINRR
jgi:hypothetical protein